MLLAIKKDIIKRIYFLEKKFVGRKLLKFDNLMDIFAHHVSHTHFLNV